VTLVVDPVDFAEERPKEEVEEIDDIVGESILDCGGEAVGKGVAAGLRVMVKGRKYVSGWSASAKVWNG
jgi:hypothetical protein